MKRTILSTFALTLLTGTAAYAGVDGSVTLGGQIANTQGSAAKANEYLNKSTGGTGSFDLNFRDSNGYFDMSGRAGFMNKERFTDDNTTRDLGFSVRGGLTGKAKAYYEYDEINHNITNGGKTFVDGVGTYSLTKPAPGSNPTLADFTKSFDYSTKRHINRGGVELSLGTPFFFSANVDHTVTTGLVPFAETTSLREFPVPFNTSTTNLTLQTGYRSDRFIALVDGFISGFNNDSDSFKAWNSTTSAAYKGYLSPDSNYYKVGGSLSYNLPFWQTVIMARANYSMLRSDMVLFDDSTTVGAQYLTPRNWNGKIDYTTVSGSITSKPLKGLDTRLFVNILNKKNYGPEDFNYGSATYTTERFDYSKRNFGADAGYKLPLATKLAAGYEYTNVHRAIRLDAPSTDDHVMYVQAKNSLLKWLSAKAKYQYSIRKSNFVEADHINDPAGPFPATAPTVDSSTLSQYYLAYFRPADTADRNQHAVKVGIDVEPLHGLSLGVEYAYKLDDYTKNLLGIQRATRHGLNFTATYVLPAITLNGYADLEWVNSNSLYRQMARQRTATVAYLPDPFGGSDANNFNWSSARQDMNMAFGIKGDVPIVKDRLDATVGYRYEKADGSNDYTADYAAAVFANSTALDDYMKHSVDAKLTFKPVANLALTAGYLYEHLKYSDDAWNGYTYVVGTNYLSGAYANQSYDNSVVYLNATYKF